MADLYSFRTPFAPVMLAGEVARIVKTDEEFDIEVISVGGMPEYLNDFGSITSGTWVLNQQVTNLQMGSLELAQLRIRVIDDIEFYLKNPAGVEQWRTAKAKFYLPQYPQSSAMGMWYPEFLFQSSEFFVWEDVYPTFDILPRVTSAKCRVLFNGWRFRVKKVNLASRPRMTLWVNGWGL